MRKISNKKEEPVVEVKKKTKKPVKKGSLNIQKKILTDVEHKPAKPKVETKPAKVREKQVKKPTKKGSLNIQKQTLVEHKPAKVEPAKIREKIVKKPTKKGSLNIQKSKQEEPPKEKFLVKKQKKPVKKGSLQKPSKTEVETKPVKIREKKVKKPTKKGSLNIQKPKQEKPKQKVYKKPKELVLSSKERPKKERETLTFSKVRKTYSPKNIKKELEVLKVEPKTFSSYCVKHKVKASDKKSISGGLKLLKKDLNILSEVRRLSEIYNVQWVLRNYDINIRGTRPTLCQKLGFCRFAPVMLYVAPGYLEEVGNYIEYAFHSETADLPYIGAGYVNSNYFNY